MHGRPVSLKVMQAIAHPSTRPLVVVPLRAGKTRLADVLDTEDRARLRAAMLTDVIAALRGADCEQIVVACGDQESATIAHDLDLQVQLDPPDVADLNAAIASACAGTPSGQALMVVTADLPSLTAADVRLVLDSRGEVVIAPTADGGTGALLRRPLAAMDTRYGPGSAALHTALARDCGLVATIMDLPGFRLDVDTEADLAEVASALVVGEATVRWLEATGRRV
ncbi:MAG: 2-phospho-L-lactate guanylyltransferase [Glaciecola sp.]|jgi:2-phospho-L-lactate guanylyltransferase